MATAVQTESGIKYSEIDGSMLEGGGQILRNAVALSCILDRPIRVYRIRQGRKPPGLRQQHLQGILMCTEIYQADVEGLKVGSTEIKFKPGEICGRTHFEADSQTAGSCCLLAQVALPILAFSDPSEQYSMLLKGGTDTDFAPVADYFRLILIPCLARFGIKAECTIERRGFYPKGGGIMRVLVQPPPINQPLAAVTMLDRGDLRRVFGAAVVSGVLPQRVAQQMRDGAVRTLKESGSVDCAIEIDAIRESPDRAFGNGSLIFLCVETSNGYRLGCSAIGHRDKQASDTGKEAAEALLSEIQHGGCVDSYCQDQIVLFAALARGTTRVRCGAITLHTETAMHVMRLLTGAQFRVTEDPQSSGSFLFEIDGIGLTSRHGSKSPSQP